MANVTIDKNGVWCHPSDVKHRTIEGSAKISRRRVNEILDYWEDINFPGNKIVAVLTSIAAAGISWAFRNEAAGKIVEKQATTLMEHLAGAAIDAMIGLGIYEWLTKDVTGSEKVKEELIDRSGSSFTVNYKIKYKQHGSNDGVYKIAYLEIV